MIVFQYFHVHKQNFEMFVYASYSMSMCLGSLLQTLRCVQLRSISLHFEHA